MKYVYILYSHECCLVGIFSFRMIAIDFAIDHKLIEGFYIEQTEIDHPNVLLKDGTY